MGDCNDTVKRSQNNIKPYVQVCTIPNSRIDSYLYHFQFVPKVPSAPDSAPKARRLLDRQESVPFPGTQPTAFSCSLEYYICSSQIARPQLSAGLLPEVLRYRATPRTSSLPKYRPSLDHPREHDPGLCQNNFCCCVLYILYLSGSR